MDAPSISVSSLRRSLASQTPPLLVDVRRKPAFVGASDLIRGALRRDPLRLAEWGAVLPPAAEVVVYCAHGAEVSRGAAQALNAAGIRASYLEGGLDAWRAAGGELARKPAGASTRWVTRERPKIDRIACPWLVRRFVDPEAEFLYVPPVQVRTIAAERDAVPFDIPEVKFSHEGERCSFDAFVAAFRLRDPALDALAVIVRGADTGRMDLAPQSAGLAAVSHGLSRVFADDYEMLEHGMVLYDALHRWCREGRDESHTWNPRAYR
jgi:rhodanese-related sulfurtransferase